jgi:Na+/proline symporter
VAQAVSLASAAAILKQRKTYASVQGARTAGPKPVTTKRSNMSSVNGAVPTTIIVAGLALAGYALLMSALIRRMGLILLAALGVLEILLLVLVGIIVARLAGGGRPAGLVAGVLMVRLHEIWPVIRFRFVRSVRDAE